MGVLPPAVGDKGFGGGLPGASVEGRDKREFVNAIKREQKWNRDRRWLADMCEIKSKCERNQRELDRSRAQAAAQVRPHTTNMRIFEILQPRPKKVRGHSEVRTRALAHLLKPLDAAIYGSCAALASYKTP